jgi:fucokinase
MTVPPHTVLHGLKQMNGRFVCRIYGVSDNPKESLLFGKKLKGDFWDPDEAHTIWNAKLYPECDTVSEAVSMAMELFRMGMTGEWSEQWFALPRKSLASGFRDADVRAILSWSGRMGELVAMNHISAMIRKSVPASKGSLPSCLTDVQEAWLRDHLSRAHVSEEMRLHYYVGSALGTAEGEKEAAEAFACLRRAILKETLSDLRENTDAKIVMEEHTVSLPLRVNWGGGWSDTPPYCNENGGTVLNAAILLNGERPVRVTLRRLTEKKIVFESRDMDARGEFTAIEPLQRVGDPFDAFVLQKAALLACGILPESGGSLDAVLERLGGGFSMDTEVTGVPQGSGLGTSSILAAACVKALCEFTGIRYSESDLYGRVLCMEQMMSTGGGWQDQIGGVTDGIKYITSRPGLKQNVHVEHVVLEEDVLAELNSRFALIYTGQRRLARNLLRDVVGRYIGNEPDTLYALNEIQRKAALMRFELERGHVDAFAALLSEHWELSKKIDAGSTNTLLDQIFDAVDDLIDGRMVCGAGGGGFLQVMLKKGATKEMLQARLKSVFQDTDINVWSCTLI